MALSSRLLRRLRVLVAGLMLAMVASLAAPPAPGGHAGATSLEVVACLVRAAHGGAAVAHAAAGAELGSHSGGDKGGDKGGDNGGDGASDAAASRSRKRTRRATGVRSAVQRGAVASAHHERPPRARGFVVLRRVYLRNATLLR